MRCDVCEAPVLTSEGPCVFCHARQRGGEAEDAQHTHLLSYIGERIPAGRTRRAGFLRRGPVRDLVVSAREGSFRARLRGEGIELEPELEIAEWVDRLLAALTLEAEADPELRAAISRAGWALRK